MRKKRILSAFLALCTILGMLPSVVLAVESDEAGTTGSSSVAAADVRLRAVIGQLTVVDSPNFFSITAGDYNNDGKDTLVVYTGCVISTSDTGLYEVTYQDMSCTQKTIGTGTGSNNDSILNSYYMSNSDSIMSSTELRNQLTVDLATGDFNNDGADDLLVLSGLNYPTSCYDACIPQLRIRTTLTGQGRTSVWAYSIGFTSEIETSAIKISFDAGCSYELSEEFTKTMDTTYTTTFEANDKNQIIIRQTVVYYYLYDVMTGIDSSGNPVWTEDSYVISVPQYPVITSLTVDQYNALANAYHDKVTELKNANNPDVDDYSLPTISQTQIEKYYLDNEGNPYNYAPVSTNYSNGYDMYLEDGSAVWMRLSHAGGTLSQVCTVSMTTEQSTTTSEGMYVNTSVMVGAETFGIGAYGGISAGYSRMSGHTYSTAFMTEKETAGAVQNLNADDPSTYSFMWKLIGWKDNSFLSGIPCIGYAVTKVSALLQPVSDLEADYSYKDGTVTLIWTTPELANGRGTIDGFKVYQDGEEIDWVDNAAALANAVTELTAATSF